MDLVFLGTSRFALPFLEELKKSSHRLLAVITTEDKPKGRGLKSSGSPVKTLAETLGLPVALVSKRDREKNLEILRSYPCDLFVVVSFGFILTPEMLALPRRFTLNVHPSLLPKYRGPAPIQWALMDGLTQTGVSIQRMNEAIDAGDIVCQATQTIEEHDDYFTLEEKLARLGVAQLLRSLEQIENDKATFTPQDESRCTHARKLTKDDGRILWGLAAETIHNRVRALKEWPGSFTFFCGRRLLVLDGKVRLGATNPKLAPGIIVESSMKDGLLVATGDGLYEIKELQWEGRKAVSAFEFLKGSCFRAGDILE